MAEMDPGPASATEKIAPPMHDAYYKARKLYIFFSLLLFSHELIGLTGVDIKGVIKDFIENVADTKIGNFKHPEALLGGYLALWLYSFIHFVIEWFQVAGDRREAGASKWDLWFTNSIAIVAVILWGSQRTSGIEVAEEPLQFLLPFFVGLIVPFIFSFRKRSKLNEFGEKQKKRYYIIFIVLSIIAPLLTLVYVLFIKKISFLTIISLVGAFIIGLWKNAQDGMPPSSPSPHPRPGRLLGLLKVLQLLKRRGKKINRGPEARSTKSRGSKQIQKPKSKEPKQKETPDRETSKESFEATIINSQMRNHIRF